MRRIPDVFSPLSLSGLSDRSTPVHDLDTLNASHFDTSNFHEAMVHRSPAGEVH